MDIFKDTNIGLPPLNMNLAMHLIKETWTVYQFDLSKKSRLEGSLRADIGYDGMIHDFKNYILRQYSEEMRKKEGMEKYTISDRTTAKVQDLLRASAVLDGRNVVEEKDLDNLFYLICMVGNKEEKTRLQGILDTT